MADECDQLLQELLNALSAIDEMTSANDINMNLAAITPVGMLVYVFARLFRFFYYALLRLGKSREETYASFRNILTDIERLLVMRDDPPDPPAAGPNATVRESHNLEGTTSTPSKTVLGSDDLGMLMLLIHECRRILWKEERRFPPEMIRSVSEDLAELAGERGKSWHKECRRKRTVLSPLILTRGRFLLFQVL